jgi:hypothetical protein
MMSLAEATGPDGSADDAAATAASAAGDAAAAAMAASSAAAAAMTAAMDVDGSSEFEPMPAVRRVGVGASGAAARRAGASAGAGAGLGEQADADEADDIAQAIAMSMGRPIDRGRRPAGAAPIVQPETPPGVRAERLMRAEQDQAYQAGLMEDEARCADQNAPAPPEAAPALAAYCAGSLSRVPATLVTRVPDLLSQLTAPVGVLG